MTLERKTEMRRISEDRLKAFGGRMPFNTLDKPDAPRTAPKAKRYTDTGPNEATVTAVFMRDKEKCACCGDPLYGWRGSEWCIAHRKLRAQGVDNRPANLYASCMACERETHDSPERARDAGRMLWSTDNPEEVPMEHAVLGRVLLTNDGGVVVIQALREENDEHPF